MTGPLAALLANLLRAQPWRTSAACAGVAAEVFFEARYRPRARLLCEGCPVRMECLVYALQADEDGWWGGTDETDRIRLRDGVDAYRTAFIEAADSVRTGATDGPLAAGQPAGVTREAMTTVPIIARRMGVARQTVHRWIASGQLAAVRVPTPGGRSSVRIPMATFEEFVARNYAASVAGEGVADLLDWMRRRDTERGEGICPRCATHSIDPASDAGWCTRCTTEAAVADDERAEREKARKRRWWNENGKSWRADRQAEQRTAAAEAELKVSGA